MTLHDRILAAADALTEPYLHTEQVSVWVNRNRKVYRHTVVLPGLLAQLHQSVIPVSSSAGAPAGGVPGSRPPLALEALSCHDEIVTAVAGWCRTLDITPRTSPESNIRALVGATVPDDRVRPLLADMRRWQRWCAVLTGWESIYRPAGVACPVVDCGRVNTLRINLTAATAMCRGCGATWSDEDGTLGLLAEYIRANTDRVTQNAS